MSRGLRNGRWGTNSPPIADENGRLTLIRVERPEEWAMGDKFSPIADNLQKRSFDSN